MIDYFVRPLGGVRVGMGRRDHEEFAALAQMRFRSKPAAVVEGPLSEGGLNLITDCQRAASVAAGPFKFTVTSPYMLSRTLLDKHYGDMSVLTLAIADILAAQVRQLPCDCLQVDEANIPGNPEDGPLAAAGINRVLDAFTGEKAVHLCFGNYGGQVIQKGEWRRLINFLNSLRCNHLVLELAHRPAEDLEALKDVEPRIQLGLGVIDVKVNHVETPDEVASRIEKIEAALGEGRLGWVHPDCGFWMLKRSVADRKMMSLVAGRNLYLGVGKAEAKA
jgi:5-methyltetrahydropteroyltriglutamate--homocysteine methyltransferase